MGRAKPEPASRTAGQWSPRVTNASPQWAKDLRAPQRRAATNRPRFERTDRVTSAWLLDLMKVRG